jgi:DNA-binding transcriptional regulator YiaG
VASQKVRKEGQGIRMSKQFPECPLYNHNNCKEIHNRKVCAIVRKDKNCLRKLHKSAKKSKKQPVTERLPQKFLYSNMDGKEFKILRKKLNKTQKQMAQLLSGSKTAVKSYEYGWRNIPAHVERQMLFLLSIMDGNPKGRRWCWVIKKCPTETKEQCPAWEFKAGKLCWLINGNICCGDAYKDWAEKMKFCRSCEVLKSFL